MTSFFKKCDRFAEILCPLNIQPLWMQLSMHRDTRIQFQDWDQNIRCPSYCAGSLPSRRPDRHPILLCIQAKASAFFIPGHVFRRKSSSPDNCHSRYTFIIVPICPSAAAIFQFSFLLNGSETLKLIRPELSSSAILIFHFPHFHGETAKKKWRGMFIIPYMCAIAITGTCGSKYAFPSEKISFLISKGSL